MNFFFSSRRRHTFFFQAEDGIRDRSPSRGLGDVYKRQIDGVYDGYTECVKITFNTEVVTVKVLMGHLISNRCPTVSYTHLTLPTICSV